MSRIMPLDGDDHIVGIGPVSPELALVDPDLARQLRARADLGQVGGMYSSRISGSPPVRCSSSPQFVSFTSSDGGLGGASAPPRPEPDATVQAGNSPARRWGARLRPAAAVVGLALVSTFIVSDVGASGRSPGDSAAARKSVPRDQDGEIDRLSTGAAALSRSKQVTPLLAPVRQKSASYSVRKQSVAETKRLAKRRSPAVRQFSWPPLADAVGYRVELFRGSERVFQRATTRPALGLPAMWTYRGRTRRLTPGAYRWYVWPVLRVGRSRVAIVRASLRVP